MTTTLLGSGRRKAFRYILNCKKDAHDFVRPHIQLLERIDMMRDVMAQAEEVGVQLTVLALSGELH